MDSRQFVVEGGADVGTSEDWDLTVPIPCVGASERVGGFSWMMRRRSGRREVEEERKGGGRE